MLSQCVRLGQVLQPLLASPASPDCFTRFKSCIEQNTNISKTVEYIKVCEIKNRSLFKYYASEVGLDRSPSPALTRLMGNFIIQIKHGGGGGISKASVKSDFKFQQVGGLPILKDQTKFSFSFCYQYSPKDDIDFQSQNFKSLPFLKFRMAKLILFIMLRFIFAPLYFNLFYSIISINI